MLSAAPPTSVKLEKSSSIKARLLADMEALADAPADPTPGWPEPADLTPRLRPVPAFEEALFPPALRPALRDVAHRMQCPPDWLAVASLVAVGAVVGNRCGIRPKQRDTAWVEVPNLWGAIVADPSKLKTPTLAAALAPLKQLDKAARDEYRLNAQRHEAAADVFKAKKEAIKKKLGKAADRGDNDELQRLQGELADLDAATAPTPRRYIVNDTTVEKLSELLGENPRGLLVFRDELTGLLNSWEKPGRESDRQFYLEAWNGTGDYSTDRIGRGSLFVPNCCLSLLGGIQPDKLAHYLRQTLHGENDGMTQRLSLLTWPDPRPFVYVDETPDAAAQDEAAELLRRLDELDPVQLGATLAAGDTMPVFHFDAAGQAEFVTWLTTWQQALDHGDDAPALVQHLAKYRKLYPALALLFHLIAVASGEVHPGPVSETAAVLAGQWCAYFAEHARRLYGFGLTGNSAATLGDHLRAKRLPNPFKVRDVQQKGWQGLNDRAAVQAAIEELSEAGWVREAAPQPAAGTGRPPTPAYECNPRIFSTKA